MFGRLMPREGRLFDLFNAHAEQMVLAARELVTLMGSAESPNAPAQAIDRYENQADKITHDTIALLHRTFITPFHREDIHQLINGMDDTCGLAEVRLIGPKLVVIRNLQTDRLESLTLPEAADAKGPRPAAEDAPLDPVVVEDARGVVSVGMSKAAVDQYLVNLTELLASAQATPRVRAAPGGRQVIDGFELRQVRAGSVVEKVGLKDGDVILEVNGEQLDGLPTVLRLFSQAQAAGQARLTVLRGTERMTFVLNTK